MMNDFIKIKFEEYYSKRWNDAPNFFSHSDILFKLINNQYQLNFVNDAYRHFEAGYEKAKEEDKE